jgi:hypothetical protein
MVDQLALREHRPAELTRAHDERIVEQPALLLRRGGGRRAAGLRS